MLKSCVGRLNTLLSYLFLVPHKITFVPLYLVDCEKDVVTIGLGDMSYEFHFAKFRRQPRDEELPSKDEIIGLASIPMPPIIH